MNVCFYAVLSVAPPAGAYGSEESRKGAGVSQQLVSSRSSAEVAAAHSRGRGSVLQHQETERRETAAGRQRRGEQHLIESLAKRIKQARLYNQTLDFY